MANRVSPREANYYAEVIWSFSGETDYSYDYWDEDPTQENLDSMIPKYAIVLETTVQYVDNESGEV